MDLASTCRRHSFTSNSKPTLTPPIATCGDWPGAELMHAHTPTSHKLFEAKSHIFSPEPYGIEKKSTRSTDIRIINIQWPLKLTRGCRASTSP